MEDEPEDDNIEEELAYDPVAGWEPSQLERLDRPPIEVFEAIEGDPKKLARYLRSDEPLSLYTIEAIVSVIRVFGSRGRVNSASI